ncbi:unnamed protein product [Cylindrotheca closterium]|uniref:Uncharacterized protein n=1 Tax=Cylindrotheca closterium TaxID=2856 RepID=A0AAD2FQS2_9STRA|nr:unnamed protein product [Cylindrotheca closterium]
MSKKTKNKAKAARRQRLERIGEEAFMNASNLRGFPFSSLLNDIGRQAFMNCSSMLEVNLSCTKVRIIRSGTFRGCISVTMVHFPPRLRLVEVSAFKDCTSLSRILNLCRGVVIEDGAFEGVPGYHQITHL